VGTDVFYTYIVYNDLWNLRVAQSGEGFVSAAPALKEGIEAGAFPADIRESFKRILDYYGQTPIIVRSSSFLEDGFGNAFAGKYDSVFCVNAGTPEQSARGVRERRAPDRLRLDPDPFGARVPPPQRASDDREEQMSLLVMRVSGSYLDDGNSHADGRRHRAIRTAPTAGCPTWTRMPACSASSWASAPRPSTAPSATTRAS
jgi:pyruvate,water dikinase